MGCFLSFYCGILSACLTEGLQYMEKLKGSFNKKRLLYILVSVFAVVIIAAAVFTAHYLKTDFDYSQKSSFAMGTVVTVKLYGDENNLAAKGTVGDFVTSVENIISRNVKGSPVDSLNEYATVQNAALSDIVNICRKISDETHGAFDLTVGSLTQLWDFDSGKEIVPKDSDIQKALQTVDYKTLTTSGVKIQCAKGQKIDLGAVGKGYALDAVKAFLEKTSVKGAVVSVGGSILAYGKRNRAADKWRVAVRDPKSEQGIIGTIKLKEGCVSTSGDYEKTFTKNGKKYHHILDATTGYPVDNDLTSVTIVCDNGLLSDALSTACFLLGKKDGIALAEKYGVGAVFIEKDENITTVGDVDFTPQKG